MTHTINTSRSERKYHTTTDKPPKNSVFVFATNSRGYHNTSLAHEAVLKYGAVMYQGHGLSGNSYAIPVWDSSGKPLRYSAYSTHIEQFLEHAAINSDREFWLTDIGAAIGIPKHILIDMFSSAPKNCIFPANWKKSY